MNDKTNIRKNVIISLIYQMVVAVSGFVLPKFLITQYGSTINGSISTIAQITSFLGILEAGMGSVASVAFYRSLSGNSEYDFTMVRNTVRRYYRFIAIISVFICTVVSLVLPFALKNSETFVFNFELALIVSCGYFVQYYMGITSQLLLAADYKSYINSFTQIIAVVLNLALSILLIQNGTDVRIVKLASAIVMLIRPIILFFCVKTKYRFSNDKSFNNNLMKQRWNNFGQSVAYYVHTQTDMVVILLFLAVAENSVYAVYMSVVTAIKTVITVIISNYNPIIGRACANKETTKDELARAFWKFTKINNFLVNVFFSVTAVLIIPFMSIYSRGFDYDYIRPELAICLCVSEYIYLFRTPYNTLINVNGHFKETQVSAFIEAGLNIVLSIILVNIMGVVGVVIATAVAMLYRTVYCILYVKKHLLDISLLEFLKTVFSTIIMTICVVTICLFIDLSYVNTYFRFIVAGCAFTLIFAVIQFTTNLLSLKRK